MAAAAVHPLGVDAPLPEPGAQPVGGMNGLPRLAGTRRSLALRAAQAAAAAAALAILLSAAGFKGDGLQLRYVLC